MDVGGWLRKLGLERYEPAFRENNIDSEILAKLTAEDLKDLGVGLVGDRRKLLDAIAALKAPAPAPAPSAVEAASSPPKASPTVTATAAEAERRQLTVLFCDLVGSTEMSARLDPEDMREVIRAYRDACSGAVARYDGFVAQFMGDGVLVYFGFPRAHEDDAERAVRAGLDIAAVVAKLDEPAKESLNVRIGIATGVVVVGDLVGLGSAQEQAVIGQTPNLAARLQALAIPGSVVIAESTRRLLGGTFELKSLGVQTLKGFDAPIPAWTVVCEAENVSRFDASRSRELTSFVGREHELALLLDCWRDASEGQGQVVLLSGEAGIGKSRILAALRERIRGEPHVAMRYQCSPHHVNDAFYPITSHIWHAAGFASEEAVTARLDKLEAMIARSGLETKKVAPFLAALLSIPGDGRYPPLDMAPSQQKDRTIAALMALFEGLTKGASVLALLEDAHWIDPTSLDIFGRLVDRLPGLRALLVVTFRPEFATPWVDRAHVASLSLSRFSRRQVLAMVDRITRGKALPVEVLEQIVAKTDGVPLFVEELTKTVLEPGLLREENGAYVLASALTPLAIPSTLHDSLMARLDRLNAAKRVAQLAAIIGREFSHELLQALAPIPEDELSRALRQLVASGLIFQRGDPPRARYRFKHALIQDAAYQSLLRAQRREQHRRVAETLEQQYPETVETRPELIAHHYTEAALAEPAIIYWRRAGERAVKQAANLEAVNHLRRGLELLEASPTRVAQAEEELRILIAFGPALMTTMTTSAPEIRQVYGRAQQLARNIGKTSDLFATVWGSYYVALASGNFPSARGLTEELFSIARGQDDPGLLLQAHHAAWSLELLNGDLNILHEQVEAGLGLYRQETHGRQALLYGGHDPAVCGFGLDALALQILGFRDRALTRFQNGLRLARRLAHPPSLVHALWMGAELHFVRSDPINTASLVAEYLPLVSDYIGSVAASNARMLRGWAMVMAGERDAGLVVLRDGINRYRGTGTKMMAPFRFGRAVAAFLEAGEIEEAIGLLPEAFQAVETGGRWYEAELYRLKGQLLLASSRDGQAGAEACFQHANALAHSQGARLFELRAAMALRRLRSDPDERKRRNALLSSVCDSFVEGFDAPELKEAKALLNELA